MNIKNMIRMYIRFMKWYYSKLLRRKTLPVWLMPSKYVAVSSAMGGKDAHTIDVWGLTKESVSQEINYYIKHKILDWTQVSEYTWKYVTSKGVVRWVHVRDVLTARSMCKDWK